MNRCFLVIFICYTMFFHVGLAFSKDILTLKRAVDMAIKNNPQVKEAIFNKKYALEQKRSSFSEMLPKISAEYSYTHLQDDPFVYFQMGPRREKLITGYTNNYSWNISVVQPIFTGLALISKYEISSLGLDIEKLKEKISKLDIAFYVKQAYFNVLLSKRRVEVMEEEVKQLRSHLMDARNFYMEGVIPKNDLLKSEVAFSIAKQRLVKAKSDLSIAFSNLNRILGKNIQELSYEVQDITSTPIFDKKLDNLIKVALKKRPEILALNRAIKQAEVGVKLARSRFFPTVSLFGQFQRSGGDLFATENKFTNEKNLLVGIQAKWEFFDSGKKIFDVKKARWKVEALKQKLKSLQDSVSLEVKKAYEEMLVAKINVETAKKALSQAKENYKVTNEGYKVQINTSTDVLDARSYLTEAEMRYYGALYGYHVAIAAISRAIGEI